MIALISLCRLEFLELRQSLRALSPDNNVELMFLDKLVSDTLMLKLP